MKKKKYIIFALFLSILNFFHHQQLSASPDIIFPLSLVLVGAGTIATVYCYKQEAEWRLKLQLIEETFDDETRKKIIFFNVGKWVCGSAAGVGALLALISGVQLLYQDDEAPVRPIISIPPPQEQPYSTLAIDYANKLRLGRSARKNISTIRGYILAIKTTETSKTRVERNKTRFERLKKIVSKSGDKKLQKGFVKKNKKNLASIKDGKELVKAHKEKLKKHYPLVQRIIQSINSSIEQYQSITLDRENLSQIQRDTLEDSDWRIAKYLDQYEIEIRSYMEKLVGD